ncbi:hypothetical protein KFE25_011826 [Diacronema lutheri]|uniref:protein disulfide-isomerase n=2 Tax=Diacronema lutheri TaxID=2081491 RepID=A0A8J5XBQ2_DIALT|nr:hypothetical protein KFE25_011826 [Diacronema lutheri]
MRWVLLGALGAAALSAPPDDALPAALSAGSFNVSKASLRARLAESGGALLLAFSSPGCRFCRSYEPEYAAYAAGAPPVPLARVDASAEKELAARYDATSLPAIVLLTEHGRRHQQYKGSHDALALASYARSRVAPRVRVLAPGLGAVDELQGAPRGEADVLAIGLFRSPDDDEADELDDLAELADALRASRPDAPVVVARATLSADDLVELARRRRWVERTPSIALWVGPGAQPRAHANLDEQLDGGLSLALWATRKSLPRVSWLTEANFHTYAASELPMLIVFVDPAQSYRAERAALDAVAPEFDGRCVFVLCDGVKFRYRKIALGLTGDALPAMALNTKDEHARYPYDGPQLRIAEPGAVRGFVADYLAGRLRPKLPEDTVTPRGDAPPPAGPVPLAGGGVYTPATPRGLEHVRNLTAADAEEALGDVRTDVLLLLFSSAQCGHTCLEQALYFSKAAARLHELGVRTVAPCRLDLATHALPPSLPVPLHGLPIVLMLPAADKQPPFRFLEGEMKPKRLLYFAQHHATHRFELPENPHLDREQNAMWHEQVGALPDERRARALESLLPEQF